MWDEYIIKTNITATRPWVDGMTHRISHDVSEKEFRLSRNAEQHSLNNSYAIKNNNSVKQFNQILFIF